MSTITFDRSIITADYQIWVKNTPYMELEWEGNSLLLAVINLLVAKIKHPARYIKLECR